MTGRGGEAPHASATGGTVTDAGAARRARRGLTASVGATAAAGGLALSVGGQTWVTATVSRQAPLPPGTEQLPGASYAPLVPAAGLLLLAAAAALVAVRGRGRVAVGLCAAVAGGVLVWSGLRPSVTDVDAAAAAVLGAGASAGALTIEVHASWPALALVAGALAVLGGALTVLGGRAWPGMGRRYERRNGAAATPAVRPTDEDRAADAWRALDRGEDPTDPPPGPGGTRPPLSDAPGFPTPAAPRTGGRRRRL